MGESNEGRQGENRTYKEKSSFSQRRGSTKREALCQRLLRCSERVLCHICVGTPLEIKRGKSSASLSPLWGFPSSCLSSFIFSFFLLLAYLIRTSGEPFHRCYVCTDEVDMKVHEVDGTSTHHSIEKEEKQDSPFHLQKCVFPQCSPSWTKKNVKYIQSC
jgi:hypothetical protein